MGDFSRTNINLQEKIFFLWYTIFTIFCMKQTLHKINGFSVMMLSAIGITLIITTHVVGAQTTSKPAAQPKIASMRVLLKNSASQKIQTLSWPRDAGRVTELDPATTHIQLNPTLQKGVSQKTFWAFRYVWSDEAPSKESFMTDSKTIAERFFTAANFGTRALSPVIKIDAPQNQNKYLTIYAFVTNKDSIVGTKTFPFGIDYVASVTYHIPEKISSPEKTAEPKTESTTPAPTPTNEWADVDTKPGYQE